MNDKNLHNNRLEKESLEFFSKGKITWEKSESEIWSELSKKIQNKPVEKDVNVVFKYEKYAAAALIVVLLGFGFLTSFYTKEVNCLPGEHIVADLPDGSKVELNAGSSLKYKPYRWKNKRKIEFEGEGFFKVEKGNKFEVISPNGTTQVLGTSFNIYTRNSNYRVTCFTGKVKVFSKANKSVTLSPNVHAELKNGKWIVENTFNPEIAVSWKNNQFFFPNTSLKEVFDEIGRQYAVTIKVQHELQTRNFTSNFTKKYSVEDVLDYVCKSMQIKFVKQSDNVFLIVENS